MSGKKFTCNSSIVTDEKLSKSAKWLYIVLSYLYSQYGFKTGYFYRTNEQLEKDSGIENRTLKKCKKELIDAGYIKVWHHNTNENTKNIRVCFYSILKWKGCILHPFSNVKIYISCYTRPLFYFVFVVVYNKLYN